MDKQKMSMTFWIKNPVKRNNLKDHAKHGTIILKISGPMDINWKKMATAGTLLQNFKMMIMNFTP
jgi:hypothetical protein